MATTVSPQGPHRYRAEADDDGTPVVPPRQHKVKPLENEDGRPTSRTSSEASRDANSPLKPSPPPGGREGDPSPRKLKPAIKPQSVLKESNAPTSPAVATPKPALKSAMKSPAASKAAPEPPSAQANSGNVYPKPALKGCMKKSAPSPEASPAAASSAETPKPVKSCMKGGLKSALKSHPEGTTPSASSETAAPAPSATGSSAQRVDSNIEVHVAAANNSSAADQMAKAVPETPPGTRLSLTNSTQGRRPSRLHLLQRSYSMHEVWAKPLSEMGDDIEFWTARGLCRRAFHRAAQKDSASWTMQKTSTVGSDGISSKILERRFSYHPHQALMDASFMQRREQKPFNDLALLGASVLGQMEDIDDDSDEDEEEDEEEQRPKKEPRLSSAEAGGTGADSQDTTNEKQEASADTGGTPPLQVNPLKELMTAKKVDVPKLRELLESLPDTDRWLAAPLEPIGPPVLPTPLFFAIGATLPTVVGLLLEFSADVRIPYDGAKMYNGWIKPQASAIESVKNRRGRFIGTMLGDRLDEILDLLTMAEAALNEASVSDGQPILKVPSKDVKGANIVKDKIESKLQEMQHKDHEKKRIVVQGANGLAIEHTQGHPSEKYDVIADLGEGALSTVKMAVLRHTSEQRAIKAEMKIEEGVLWDEINIMRKIYHPNVINLFETFEDETNIFVVLELCTGGELFNRLSMEGGIQEACAARIMRQLASAVRYLHDQSVAHRDIQPENWLLKDDGPLMEAQVKLIDFTTAKEFGPDNPMKTKICTLHYCAPEILTKKEIAYSAKVDVWSLGVMFFVMLCGAPPFHGETEVAVLKRIKKGNFKFEPEEVWDTYSTEAKDLVEHMLVVDADKRDSAAEVLKHEWMQADFNYSEKSKLTVEQLNNLRNFHARNRVQKVTMRLKAHKLAPEAKSSMADLFRRLDKDGMGQVPIQAIREKIRHITMLEDHMEEIMRVLWSLEQENQHTTIGTFLESMEERHKAVQKEACRAIFDVFDFDGSGEISGEELTMALSCSTDKETFKNGIEMLFGMSSDAVGANLGEDGMSKAMEEISYTFEQFYEIMQSSALQTQ